MRAARAFIDPELESGVLTPAQGKRVLTDDVMLSEAFAGTEIERYTFQAPGQATSYFYGYLQAARAQKGGRGENRRPLRSAQFHDFILAQGLLPPDLLRKAVLDDFVGAAVK